MNARKHIWRILEPAEQGDLGSRVFDITISLIIACAVLATVLESEPLLYKDYATSFQWFEYFCLLVFVPEYLLRFWSCSENPKFDGVAGKLRWMISPMALVDLFAILPSLLMFSTVDLRILRAVRLLRLLRFGRYSRGLRLLLATFHACARQLVVTLSGVLVFLLLSASVLYYAERIAQPESFGSIPRAMWWAVCTLTTVGYGDVCPITLVGKICASVIAVLGIASFALPAGIIAGNFEKVMNRTGGDRCPHCGEEL